MNCRHCNATLEHTFLDLGFAPPSNAYLTQDDLSRPEVYFPLKLKVCTECWLVQTEDYAEAGDLFSAEYAYFSSTSKSWLAHAKQYVEKMTELLDLTADSYVIELASNDGYLLKNFVNDGIPCLGIEPTDSTASAAELLGVPVLREFFGEKFAKQLVADGVKADLVIGNNVYAHVPDINDFTRGMKCVLNQGGTITLEFPHLMRLIEFCQFDTVYHEHFSYLSLYAVNNIFERWGLRIFDVELLPTHGGSLRIYGCHADDTRTTNKSVEDLLHEEELVGLRNINTYTNFQQKADKVKNDLLRFLLEMKEQGKRIIGYGAAAKGNTLLNYAGVKPDLLPAICDAAPAKQNMYMPGSHIGISSPDIISQHKPDVVLILPWNISTEVVGQLDFIRAWGGQFAVAVPEMKLMDA